MIEAVNRMQYPPELKPVAIYYRESLTLALWIYEHLFNFYRSWNADELKQPYRTVDTARSCREVIHAIESTNNTDEKYRIAQHDWNNCVIVNGRKKFAGDYPEAAWRDFRRKYDLIEHFVDDAIEGDRPR